MHFHGTYLLYNEFVGLSQSKCIFGKQIFLIPKNRTFTQTTQSISHIRKKINGLHIKLHIQKPRHQMWYTTATAVFISLPNSRVRAYLYIKFIFPKNFSSAIRSAWKIYVKISILRGSRLIWRIKQEQHHFLPILHNISYTHYTTDNENCNV